MPLNSGVFSLYRLGVKATSPELSSCIIGSNFTFSDDGNSIFYIRDPAEGIPFNSELYKLEPNSRDSVRLDRRRRSSQ